MKHFDSVVDLVNDVTQDAMSIALEGYNHLIPFAFAHELIRVKRKNLHLMRLSADIVSDQLVGSGCVAHLTTGWQGNPIGGVLHRLNDARNNSWPRAVEFYDLSHPSMIAGYTAGASKAPFAFVTDLPMIENSHAFKKLRKIKDPYTGDQFSIIPAIVPDLAVLHAQRADIKGNVQFEGFVGACKEIAYAARKTAITVEEIVESLDCKTDSLILPSGMVDSIAIAPRGASPSYAFGMYDRDIDFYLDWPRISTDRVLFSEWLDQI